MWTIFCAVVDNYGDLGFCLRLARQLRSEHAVDVTLWVDDAAVVESFLGLEWSGDVPLRHDGIHLRHWCRPWTQWSQTSLVAASDVIIEAFACDIPDQVVDAMARRETPPLWINLEYLSAESWAGEYHLLRSMISASTGKVLTKTFFFPGFAPDTGGLLRERDLLERHAVWQRDEVQSRAALLGALNTPAQIADDTLLISVFTYESPSLAGWLEALSVTPAPVCCLIPEGRVLTGVSDWFGHVRLKPGDILTKGSLTVIMIPFMSQDQYDGLLGICDFNLVRGEDSFVRAQWAARPLLWHIYPQQEEAHLVKLQAFLDLYGRERDSGGDDTALIAMSRFWLAWNRGEDCGDLWHHLRPQLPSLREHARKWQRKLAKRPDLAANLLRLQRDWQHEQHSQPRGQ